MPLTAMELVSAMLVILLGMIVIMVARRLRHSGQYAIAEGQTGPAFGRLPITTERQTPAVGSPIKPLSAEMRTHFITTWQSVQAQFVDDPRNAVTRADNLLAAALVTRGYPRDSFAQRAGTRSAEQPDVQYYTSGDEAAATPPHVEATTEDLRTAMIHFRSLFDNLVSEPDAYARQPAMRQNSLS